MSPDSSPWFMDTQVPRLAPDAPVPGNGRRAGGAEGLARPLVHDGVRHSAATRSLSIGRIYIEREYGTCTVLFLSKLGVALTRPAEMGQAFADKAKALYQDEVKEPSAARQLPASRTWARPTASPTKTATGLSCSVACVYSYDAIRGDVLTETLPAT
jgi:hypothetical protein